ncbi:hypothetical protein SAMN05443665_1007146 [Actinomadura meyerae]|uniref:DUF4352 domain-containing protein n=1 Tax=Actinomadura meyerae TaxID=240840 RepID=A0A239GDL1_9ACTN|nr:DUF4352 domain-containing protein [Actinomadura meyerae]SNS67210.1 hypothetical protein SAMN05443665_1007146 [Actinomadura meyerae]
MPDVPTPRSVRQTAEQMSRTDRLSTPGARWLLPLRAGVALVIACGAALLVWAVFFSAEDGPDLPHEGKAGQEVTDGTVIYRLTRVRCGLRSPPGAPGEKPDNGQFCELTLDVRNPGGSPASWDARLAAGNATYAPEWHLEQNDAKALTGRTEADEHRTGRLVFDIARSADPVELTIGVGLSGDAGARISL